MRPNRTRCVEFILLTLFVVFLFKTLGFWEDKFSVQRGFVYRLRDGDESHPVENLHAAAKKQFFDLLSRQSVTAADAVVEYRRRYGRNPPPEFNKWFAFAKKHASLIVDDYDEMMRSLEPFRKMAPSDVLRIMERANSTEQTRGYIKKCSVVQGKLKDCGAWAHVMSRSWSIEKVLQDLPNIIFIANYMDEPAVLAKHQTVEVSPVESDEKFMWSTIHHEPIWPQVWGVCDKISEHKQPETSLMTQSLLHFVGNVTPETDLCKHPEFKEIHGYLASAINSLHIDRAVPVLSRAVPYPFGDILFPAPSYSWAQFSYSSWRDRSWHRKKDALYWAGSNTGSYTRDETWRRHHRQRLVLLGFGKISNFAGQKGKKSFTYLERAEQRSHWTPYTTSRFDRSLYNVAITKISECDEPACQQQKETFRPPRNPKSSSEPYRYKYVFDIDGNSLSGRFYRLLASNSAVLKTTIFKEWHDERLIPWLHYIPVSLGFDELPELMRFLATTDEGREIGRRVAQEGKAWHAKGLREVDRGVYFYRLLIELAWLQNPDRVAS
ncbi:hypothetical protein GLAREA_12831 [Glarea lozoyensis ATCC 20868]|uniref:Glycosyl transferase CAP10 domain-containing protein n=1 Tax=Glarea lozoyensis (strain ATCC 20868 / MF5171) TaxID=1116229 RepID=S3DUK4_GLAL2|nr:uncharacterized protein GLAREA_12831 [Glarea lozoyensis ATCC 20868]EPE30108.1 hypothetical protein GLAREA_12831 [Glarea lozoyensis ATCC 20868]